MSITTEQLIADAKEAADLTNVSDYVTNATWLSWCNAAIVELHRFVTNKFASTYIRTYDFTLDADESQITLPTNFWRLKGLDIDPDTPRRREVRPYNFAERNRFRQNTFRSLEPWCVDRRYNLIGSSKLKIQAEEQASGNYRLYYTPKPKMLALVRTLTRSSGNDTLTVGFDADGHNRWRFVEADFDTYDDVDALLTISGDTNEAGNNGTFPIVEVTSASDVLGDPYAGDESETFQDEVVATVTRTLDAELEPYAEYLWLTMAVKSLIKEESFQQAAMLNEQRKLIRDDLTEAVETDEGGPRTVIDTDDDGAPY